MSIYPGIPLLAAAIVAQAAIADASPVWWQPLAQYGLAGIVLGWLMFRMEKIMQRNTDALNLNSYTTSTAILASKHKDAAIEELAAKLQEQAKTALVNAPKTPAG